MFITKDQVFDELGNKRHELELKLMNDLIKVKEDEKAKI